MTGEYEKHGKKAEPYVREIVEEYNSRWGKKLGRITEAEMESIISAARVHSGKLDVMDDAYVEMLKDVDSFDSYLHGFEAEDSSGRRNRVIRVFKELNLDVPEGLQRVYS
jgi:hypothetical protein